MTDIDRTELRRLAEAATPGPWRNSFDPCHFDSPEVTDDKTFSYYVPHKTDAAYIAAASPDKMLALLDALASAERERDALHAREAHPCIDNPCERCRQCEASTGIRSDRTHYGEVERLAAVTADRDSLAQQLEAMRKERDEARRERDVFSSDNLRRERDAALRDLAAVKVQLAAVERDGKALIRELEDVGRALSEIGWPSENTTVAARAIGALRSLAATRDTARAQVAQLQGELAKANSIKDQHAEVIGHIRMINTVDDLDDIVMRGLALLREHFDNDGHDWMDKPTWHEDIEAACAWLDAHRSTERGTK